MQLSLQDINLVLSIILQLILIVGLFVLFASLISFINKLNKTVKSVSNASKQATTFLESKSLKQDYMDYFKNSIKYFAGKSILNLVYKYKDKYV